MIHIVSFLIAYLDIFYSTVIKTKGNKAIHAHCLIFCIWIILQHWLFVSLVNKERTGSMKQEHKWISLDLTILWYLYDGLSSIFTHTLTSQLQNSNPQWEDRLIGNLKILHQGTRPRFLQSFCTNHFSS